MYLAINGLEMNKMSKKKVEGRVPVGRSLAVGVLKNLFWLLKPKNWTWIE